MHGLDGRDGVLSARKCDESTACRDGTSCFDDSEWNSHFHIYTFADAIGIPENGALFDGAKLMKHGPNIVLVELL